MTSIRFAVGLLFLAMVAACATPPRTVNREPIEPVEAIRLAAAAEGRPVPGTFALEVRAGGVTNGITYLNSEEDYRDQRCLTLAIAPPAAADLERQFGAPLQESLVGHRVVVTGAAQRVRIDFTGNGVPTGKYYYQTHVPVTAANQVAVR